MGGAVRGWGDRGIFSSFGIWNFGVWICIGSNVRGVCLSSHCTLIGGDTREV